MNRRKFLAMGPAAAAWMAAQEEPRRESVTATATQDKTPRVAVIPSSFEGSEDHDGTKIGGLAEPRPVDADLTAAQIDAMVRKALEVGIPRTGGWPAIIGPEDWVVIKTDVSSFSGLNQGPGYVSGCVTDLRVVRSVIGYLVENKLGLRFTIAEGAAHWRAKEHSGAAADGWTTDWGGAFGGLSYKGMVEEFSKRHPEGQFEIADLNFDDSIESPTPGGVSAKANPQGMYHVPQTIRQCDRLISVAPLKTDPTMGVSLSLGNYYGIGPGAKYGFPKSGLDKLGARQEVVVDLFSFHPADYAILGGCWGVEGGGESVHYNAIIAGANAVAVDAVGAAVMGFDPASIRQLELAERNGFGIRDTDSIWVRGRETEEAKRPFKKPPGWG